MEYIVSARKYRPMTFDTVVGQSALTTTLKNAVKSGKLAHAYLFCGPRGVGKTTCARIFAKAINCQNPTADGEACNECESCQSFNEQRSLNIFEARRSQQQLCRAHQDSDGTDTYPATNSADTRCLSSTRCICFLLQPSMLS